MKKLIKEIKNISSPQNMVYNKKRQGIKTNVLVLVSLR